MKIAVWSFMRFFHTIVNSSSSNRCNSANKANCSTAMDFKRGVAYSESIGNARPRQNLSRLAKSAVIVVGVGVVVGRVIPCSRSRINRLCRASSVSIIYSCLGIILTPIRVHYLIMCRMSPDTISKFRQFCLRLTNDGILYTQAIH